jgi:iodotyrosine deiodinase
MENFIPLRFTEYKPAEMLQRSTDFYVLMNGRRTVRQFSDRPVDIEVIKNAIRTAGTAPSGAHKQPWHFAVISSEDIKSKIREAAEKEEYQNYHGRMSEEWLEDLKKFGTDHIKPFLEIAPYLIVVFKKVYDLEEGDRKTNYYVNESVGIACGMLLAALHHAGLATLTHTPSPMNFLSDILERPKNERAFLLIPVGYPANGAEVPDIERKSLNEISTIY